MRRARDPLRYQCTECLRRYPTITAASRCHWGIGGVVERGYPGYVEDAS